MSIPVVSIITVAYNHEKYIAKCIESVLSQDVDFKIEMIIGEDCSTDQTRSIIKMYEAKYPEIIKPIYNDNNLGGRENYINVVKKAQGKYTAHLDGDDYMLPRKLSLQVEYMENNADIAMSGHGIRMEDSDGNIVSEQINHLKLESGKANDFLKYGAYIANVSVMCRRNFLDIELFDRLHKLRHGDLLIHMIVSRNGGVGYIDQVLSVYRKHSMGVSSIALDSVENRLNTLTAQINILDKAHLLNIDARAISFARTQLNLNVGFFMLKRNEKRYALIYFIKALTLYLPGVLFYRLIIGNGKLTILFTKFLNWHRGL
jgi:glycosyltransferase involved in cell wall biosynthesis